MLHFLNLVVVSGVAVHSVTATVINGTLASSNSSCNVTEVVTIVKNVTKPDGMTNCEWAASIVMDDKRASTQPLKYMKILTQIQIININSIDPITETVNVGFKLEMSWTDQRLDYSHTGCKMSLMIDRISSIWYPIFMITNMASDMDYGALKDRSAIVEPSGKVTWPLYMYSSLSCSMIVTYFPFDIEACTIAIASLDRNSYAYTTGYAAFLAYTGNNDRSGDFSLDFITKFNDKTPGIQFYPETIQLSLWEVTGACSYSKSEEITGNIYFLFRLERKSMYHVVTLVIPTLVVSCLMATTFVADQNDDEKLSISITGVLSYFFILSLISTQIPANADSVPYVMYFIAFLLVGGTIVTFLAVFIRKLTEQQFDNGYEAKRYKKYAKQFNTISFIFYTAGTFIVYVTLFTWLKVTRDEQRQSSLGAMGHEVKCNITKPELADA